MHPSPLISQERPLILPPLDPFPRFSDRRCGRGGLLQSPQSDHCYLKRRELQVTQTDRYGRRTSSH